MVLCMTNVYFGLQTGTSPSFLSPSLLQRRSRYMSPAKNIRHEPSMDSMIQRRAITISSWQS